MACPVLLPPHAAPRAVTVVPGAARLVLSGELDLATAPALDDAFATLSALRPAEITVELAAVTFLDATTLGRLVGCRNAQASRGATLRIVNPSPWIRRVFDLGCLSALLSGVTDGATRAAPVIRPSPAADCPLAGPG